MITPTVEASRDTGRLSQKREFTKGPLRATGDQRPNRQVRPESPWPPVKGCPLSQRYALTAPPKGEPSVPTPVSPAGWARFAVPTPCPLPCTHRAEEDSLPAWEGDINL